MSDIPVNVNRLSTDRRSTGEVPNGPGRQGKQKRYPLKLKLAVVGAVVALLLVVAAVGWLVYRSSSSAHIDSNKYQAVFFTNGQVYFGKLQKLSGDYFRLNDIFYIQAKPNGGEDDANKSQNPQETSEQTASDLQLIKLGSEVHGPEDEMIISKEQILFFENLKKDGKVSDTINKYHKQ